MVMGRDVADADFLTSADADADADFWRLTSADADADADLKLFLKETYYGYRNKLKRW